MSNGRAVGRVSVKVTWVDNVIVRVSWLSRVIVGVRISVICVQRDVCAA